MNNKIKTIIATIAGSAIISFTAPVIPGEQSYTVNEWQFLVKMYDYEIQLMIKENPENEKLLVKEFESQEKFIETINERILQRKVTEQIQIDNKIYPPEEYQKIRDELINKKKNKTVVQKLLD